MLDLSSAADLLAEIDAAEKLRNAHSSMADRLVKDYVSSAYRSDWRPDGPTPENHCFEFVSLMLGRLVADNPQVAVTTQASQFDGIAYAIEQACNKWIKDESLQDTLQLIVMDAIFCFGVSLTTFVKDTDAGTASTLAGNITRMKPQVLHVPYWRYFRDPASYGGVKCRYEGHTWIKDLSDLEADKTVDQQSLAQLTVDADLKSVAGPFKSEKIPSRNQIVGYEVWVPEISLSDDPDTHGALYTLGTVATKDGKERLGGYLRKPRPYYGPKTGPYRVFGGWPVPGSPYPMSPLAATKEQVDELNAHVTAVAESAEKMKDVLFLNSTDADLAKVAQSARHGSIHAVRGYVPGKIDKVTIGGPSPQQLQYIEMARERLDRNSGINDAMRGNLDPNVTATANNIASQASSVRVDTQIGFVKRQTAATIRTAAWYMFKSEFFQSFLGRDAADQFGMKSPLYVGGDHPSTAGLRFEDLDLDIQPYSMERVDPVVMQGRVQQVIGMVTSLAAQMPQMPWVNWDEIIDQLARAHNFSWLKQLINKQILAQIMQAQMQPQQPQPPQPKPPSVPGVSYIDAPPDVKAQIETMNGLRPSQLWTIAPLYDPSQPKSSGDPRTAVILPQGMGAQSLADPRMMMAKMMGAGATGQVNSPMTGVTSGQVPNQMPVQGTPQAASAVQ